MTIPHDLLSYRYLLNPSKAQRRELERLLEAERLLYNAALQEWRDSYSHACRLASILGMERPARWRLVELARQAGMPVAEDRLEEKKRVSREKLLAEHKAA